MQAPQKARRTSSPEPPHGPGWSLPTVYDAVAGRVYCDAPQSTRNIPLGRVSVTPEDSDADVSEDSGTDPGRHVRMTPDEVLFMDVNAPIHYKENDISSADRHLGPHQRLPDSDLLKALHAYASDFYAASLGKSSKQDWESMDETALLALGILMEEAAADVLGQTGDLAFIEGGENDRHDAARAWNGTRWTRSVIARNTPRRSAREEGHAGRPRSKSRAAVQRAVAVDAGAAADQDTRMGSPDDESASAYSGKNASTQDGESEPE